MGTADVPARAPVAKKAAWRVSDGSGRKEALTEESAESASGHINCKGRDCRWLSQTVESLRLRYNRTMFALLFARMTSL